MLSLIFLITLLINAFPEILLPIEPEVADVEFKEKKVELPQKPDIRYRCLLVQGNNYTNKGNIFFEISEITFIHIYNNQKYRTTLSISNIQSIEIQNWIKSEQKKNIWLFKPGNIIIQTRNNQTFSVFSCPLIFYKLKFKNELGNTSFFTTFYDKWEKDKWLNTENTDFNQPLKTPHEKSVKKIIFFYRE